MVKIRTYRNSIWPGYVWVLAVGGVVTLISFLRPGPDRVPWFQRPAFIAGTHLSGWIRQTTGKALSGLSSKEENETDRLRQTISRQAAALAAAEEARLERDRLRALLKIATCSSEVGPRSVPVDTIRNNHMLAGPHDGPGSAALPPGSAPLVPQVPGSPTPATPRAGRWQSHSAGLLPDCGQHITARVIAHDPRALFKTIVVDRGALDGVAKGMVALAGEGLVGRVEAISRHSSTILLLIDPNHAVDVWVQRTRVRGLLVGSGRNALMQRLAGVSRIEYLSNDADMGVDDVVVTTGLDGRYPKGIPVGKIRTVRRGSSDLYASAEVVPFVDWGAVEEIVLLPESGHE